jgi:hypothetical protein
MPVWETRVYLQSLKCRNCPVIKAPATFNNDLDYITSGQRLHVFRYHGDTTVEADHPRRAQFLPTVLSNFTPVCVTMHPAVVGTHFLALLVYHF